MTEMLICLPVMITMWFGIDYFRSGFARRLEALNKSHQLAWQLAYSNDGSCFANKEPWAGFFGENNPTDASNVGEKGAQATSAFAGNTSSSLFVYGHANVRAELGTKKAHFQGGATGQVRGGTFITCNEVVPVTSSNDPYADRNVITPLWDFVRSIF
jgi:hypothetical protein